MCVCNFIFAVSQLHRVVAISQCRQGLHIFNATAQSKLTLNRLLTNLNAPHHKSAREIELLPRVYICTYGCGYMCRYTIIRTYIIEIVARYCVETRLAIKRADDENNSARPTSAIYVFMEM